MELLDKPVEHLEGKMEYDLAKEESMLPSFKYGINMECSVWSQVERDGMSGGSVEWEWLVLMIVSPLLK